MKTKGQKKIDGMMTATKLLTILEKVLESDAVISDSKISLNGNLEIGKPDFEVLKEIDGQGWNTHGFHYDNIYYSNKDGKDLYGFLYVSISSNKEGAIEEVLASIEYCYSEDFSDNPDESYTDSTPSFAYEDFNILDKLTLLKSFRFPSLPDDNDMKKAYKSSGKKSSFGNSEINSLFDHHEGDSDDHMNNVVSEIVIALNDFIELQKHKK